MASHPKFQAFFRNVFFSHKRLLIVFLLLLCLLVGGSLVSLFFFDSAPIYIAAVRPGRDPVGDDMLRGIQLYLERINTEGGIGGRRVELLVSDDQNTMRQAMNTASEIVLDNRALLVLGHYYSTPSLAAGDVYKKNGIPAITASATAEAITIANDWYFSITPDNRLQGEFIANYLKHILKQNRVSMIVDSDSYGTSLAQNFVNAARKLGISIRARWDFDRELPNLAERLGTIISELRSDMNPGAIFFATYETEAVKIIRALKFPGTDYLIIGPDSFATPAFIEEFRRFPQEQAQPGYYSDEIYAITPFMMEIADEKAFAFREEFSRKYGEAPSWIAASYYDAAKVAVEAIKQAEIHGKGDVRENRRKIQTALAQFDNEFNAVEGITGSLYFNPSGSVERSFVIGQYEYHKLLPSFSQYRIASSDEMDSRADDVSKGEIIRIGNRHLIRTNIAYIGVDINEISDLDIRNSRYTADFYLWFRFQGDFEDNQVIFPNAIEPITLPPPIVAKKTARSMTHTYRVNADFTNTFDFRAYPFDQQLIRVSFHHANETTESLFYVPDLLRMFLSDTGEHLDETAELKVTTGWKIDTIACAQSVFRPRSDVTQAPQEFSQFHAEVVITREGWGSFLKPFFPLGVMLIILYFVYFLPPQHSFLQGLISLAILITNTLYYRQLTSIIPRKGHFLTIEYAFWVIYALTALAIGISLRMYILHKRETSQRLKFWLYTGRIFHPLAVIVAGIVLGYMYYVL